MQTIQADTTADLYFQINWASSGVRHTDAYTGHQVNFWRDIMPGRLCAQLQGKKPGDAVQLGLPSDELLDAAGKQDLRTIDRRQFDARRFHNTNMEPRPGRFYPKGLLKDMAGIFAANVAPFRCVQVDNDHLAIDLGHPLSEKRIDLNVTVGTVRLKSEERGGTLRSWGERITQGVGMQARWQDRPTDFFSDAPFERLDGSADAIFYTKPRLVQHIDDTALDMVRQIQARFVQTDMSVFEDLHTYSVRGLARPVNDKYYGQLPYSDPVYTVWGQRI